jgi:hypothetical protein
MIQLPPRKIIWFYAEMQDLYHKLLAEIPNLVFVKGMPLDMEPYLERGNLLIFDDLQAEINPALCELFTKHCHHRGTSCFLLMQNGLLKGRENRTISLNAHYMILMKNPRDSYQAQVLSRQIMGDKAGKFMDMYRRGTARPHGYLVVDLKQETPDGEKLKIGIFGENSDALVPLVKEEPTYPMAPSFQQPNPMVIPTSKPMASYMTYQGCTLPTQPWNECLKKESGMVSSGGQGYPPGIPCDRDNRMLSCAYCGFVFETYRDLEKHEERCDADSSSSEDEIGRASCRERV